MVGTNYKNITISGLPGVGSSTLGKMLTEKLGWDYFSGGDFMRSYAIEKGLFDSKDTTHHSSTIYADDFDREVDYGMRARMKKEKWRLYDSWLSGFLAQGVPKTLKILMTCSEDTVRVDRLANRDNMTISDAKKHIFEREKENLAKWQRIYAKEWEEWVVNPGTLDENQRIYFWRPELYDLVIDTFQLSKEEVLKKSLEKIKSNS